MQASNKGVSICTSYFIRILSKKKAYISENSVFFIEKIFPEISFPLLDNIF